MVNLCINTWQCLILDSCIKDINECFDIDVPTIHLDESMNNDKVKYNIFIMISFLKIYMRCFLYMYWISS